MGTLRPQLPKGASFARAADIHRLADALSPFRNIAVLTGAGISTESGLSDYRSPGKNRPPIPPINHNEYVSLSSVRQRYWARSFVGYPLLSGAKPGLAHHALAALHDHAGAIFRAHVTQNVDGLLHSARVPSARIVELHGSIHWLVCRVCGARESRTAFQTRLSERNVLWSRQLGTYEFRADGDAELDGSFIAEFNVPPCKACGANDIMPTVVFHGGSVPQTDADAATRVIEQCDALLIVGSTVTPYSAFRLVRMAKKDGKFVGCINFGQTRADDLIDIKVEALVGDAVARLADLILVSGFKPPPQFDGVFDRLRNVIPGTGMLQL